MTHPNRSRSRAGFALAVVLMVLLLLTVMGLVLGAMGAANLQQMRTTGEQVAVLHSANGGLHELMDVLYNNDSYGGGSEAGSGTYTSSSGSLNYWYSFDASSGQPYCTNNLNGTSPVTGYGGRTVPPGMALLYVAGDTKPQNESTSPMWVAAVATNRYPYAIASDGTIDIADVSSVIPGHGHVRSNAVGGNPNIDADLVDGQTFSRDGDGSIDVDSGSGPENYDEPPISLPDLPIPDILASWSTAGLGGAHPYGGPADYQYSSDVTATTDASGNVDIGGDHITPPATIYVDGNVRINGGADIAPGIHFFCTGDFRVDGALNQVSFLWEGRRPLASRGGKGGEPTPSPSPTATSTPSPSPTATATPSPTPTASPSPSSGLGINPKTNFIISGGEIRFNGGSAQSINLLATTGIRQNGSSTLNGFFYVRSGPMDLNGSHSVTGVIITKTGVNDGDIIAGGADVIYDPAVLQNLQGLSIELRGTCRTTAWWVEQ